MDAGSTVECVPGGFARHAEAAMEAEGLCMELAAAHMTLLRIAEEAA